MPTINASAAPQTITMDEGRALSITGSVGAAGVVYRLDPVAGGTNSVQSWVIGAGALATIGPYLGQQKFLVTCSAGSIDTTLRDAVLGVAATTSIAALVADIRAAYADASARNPFVLGVMVTPPAVTNPASSPLPAAYGYATGTNSKYFNISGATAAAPQFIDTSFGNYLRIKGARNSASNYVNGPTWTISWTAICSSIDISVLGSSLPYRMQVDGAWVTAAGITTAGNATINFNFSAAGGVKKRVFTLEMSQDQGISEVRLGNNDTLYANPIASPTILGMGDSYMDGTLSPSGMSGNSFPGVLRAMLGCNFIAQGLGGTGYVVASTGLALTSSIRLDDAAAVAPDVILIAMGTNDVGQPGVTAATIAVLRGLRARLPSVKIIVVGPWGQAMNLSAALLQTEADILAGFTVVADSLMRFIPMNRVSATTTPWTTGTGYVGAATTSGNSSVMIGPDQVHPSAAIGGIYYGQRMAAEFMQALISMAKSQG